jgi:hypothetical protein
MHFLKFVFDIGEEAMWLSNLFHIVVWTFLQENQF